MSSMHCMWPRIASLLALLPPAGCSTTPLQGPDPGSAEIQVEREFIVRAGMPLDEFIRAAGEFVGIEIVVTPGLEDAVKDRAIRSFGLQSVPREDFVPFLQTQLMTNMMCDTSSLPWRVRAATRNDLKRLGFRVCPFYVLPEELDEYANREVELSTILSVPDSVVRDLLASLHFEASGLQLLQAGEDSLVVQGPAATVVAVAEFVRACAERDSRQALPFGVPERDMSIAELIGVARELLEVEIAVAPGLVEQLKQTPVVAFGAERLDRDGFAQFFEIQLFINDIVWDRSDSPSVVRPMSEGDLQGRCSKEILVPEDL